MAELASAAPTSGGVSDDWLAGQSAEPYATHPALLLDLLLFFSQMAQSPCLDRRLYVALLCKLTNPLTLDL
jgi:hypothetical protein